LLGEFTVLDPACGDGAFLLGTLRFLVQQINEKGHRQKLVLRSLMDSIHGIDIDKKAIKDCRSKLGKLSKQLLGYSADFTQRIHLGNSLIAEDKIAFELFGDQLADRHPVNWHQLFPWVMRDAGFDVVIGNPPYIGVKAIDASVKDYIRHRYRTTHQQFDILVAFIELGLNLLRPGGRLGYIISNKVLAADYGSLLRRLLVRSYVIEQMVDVSHLDVFKGAATYPHILILRKPRKPGEVEHNKVAIRPPPSKPKDLSISRRFTRIPQHYYSTLPNSIITPTLTIERFQLLQRMQHNTQPLGKIFKIRCGIAKTGFRKHIIKQEEFHQLSNKEQQSARPFLSAGDVRRYKLRRKRYMPYSSDLTSPDQWKDYEEPKIVIAGMGKHLRAAIDVQGSALGRVYYVTESRSPINLYYLLGLLNSNLIDAYYSLLFVATHLRSGYIRYNASYLEQIPFVQPDSFLEAKITKLAKQAQERPRLLKRGLDQDINIRIATLYGLTLDDVSVLTI
jgi:hypothetical protein